MIPKHCKYCSYFDSLGSRQTSSGVCALPKDGDIQVVKSGDFCVHDISKFKINTAAAPVPVDAKEKP